MPGGGKNKSHKCAATKQAHGNRPEQHNHFLPLYPQRLMPEKEFSQKAEG